MPRKGKREYVTFKSVRLALYPHGNRWRVAYPDESVKGGWRYITRSTKPEAKEAGHAKAVEIANGLLDLSNLSDEEARLCRAFIDLKPTWDDLNHLKSRKARSAVTYREAVESFSRQLPQPLSRTHAALIAGLHRFEKAHEVRISDLTRADLADYAASRPPGSYRHIRAQFVSLFKWAAREGIVEVQNGLTEADKLRPPDKRVAKAIRFLSPEEATVLLREVGPGFLPWLVFALFSGLRSEEIAPADHAGKDGLDWSQVKKDHIDLRADQSKVRKRRLVPMSDSLRTWLAHIGPPTHGRVCWSSPARGETKRLGQILDSYFKREEGWPRNVLRHTFLTYSAALRQDLPAIAIEAGTSVSKLNTNYVEVTSKEQAGAFFALVPSDVYRTFSTNP